MKRRGKKWYFAPHSESISNTDSSRSFSQYHEGFRWIATAAEKLQTIERVVQWHLEIAYHTCMYVPHFLCLLAAAACWLLKSHHPQTNFFLCNRHLNACVYRRTSVDRTVKSKSVLQVTPHTRAMPFACSIIFIDCTHIDYVCVCLRALDENRNFVLMANAYTSNMISLHFWNSTIALIIIEKNVDMK